jgi:hypothetical protein
LAASAAAASITATAASDEDVIRALRRANNAAIAARDSAATMAAMAPSIVLVDSAGTVFIGNKTLTDDYAAHEFNDPTFIAYDRVTERVDVSAKGGFAAEYGRWTARNRLPGGGERQKSGVYLSEWVKVEGTWKIQTESYVGLGCGQMATCNR